jgi:hypothetical protein
LSLEFLENRGLPSVSIFTVPALVAVEAVHHRRVSFEGTATGMTTSVTPIPGGIATSVSATGWATHFGRFTLTASDHDLFTSSTTLAIEDGVGTLTRSDGDQLFVTYHGTGTITGNLLVTDLDITITGGTGKFAGATGSLVSKNGVTNLATEAVTFPLAGVITRLGKEDRVPG